MHLPNNAFSYYLGEKYMEALVDQIFLDISEIKVF